MAFPPIFFRIFATTFLKSASLDLSRAHRRTCSSSLFTLGMISDRSWRIWLSPFFTTFGHTRQILMSVALILFLILPKFLAAILSVSLPSLANVMTVATNIFYGLLVLSSISLLIPNPRNREDNTSGVIGLLALADRIKDQPAIKEKVQFVFIDNEEWGLLGSGGLKELWDRRGYPYRNAVVISMDCISRGQVPLLIYNGKDHCARQVLPHLQKYLPEARLMSLGFIPLSDNFTFRDQGAMNITFTDRTILPGGYYVPRIHAPNDHDLASQRLASCVQGLYEYIEVGSV